MATTAGVMEISGEQTLAAPPDAVWAMISDPEQLATVLPTDVAVQLQGPDQMTAHLVARMGAAAAALTVEIIFSARTAPDFLSLNIAADGGSAGAMALAGWVRLEAAAAGTRLSWACDLQLSGSFALLTPHLAQAITRRRIGWMLKRIQDRLVVPPAPPPETPPPDVPEPVTGLPSWLWTPVLILLTTALVLLAVRL